MTTTTSTTTPKRRRARRRKPTVAMNKQQPALKVELPSKDETRVKPDVQLITIQQYQDDFQARLKIHNYEVAELLDELKIATAWINKQVIMLIKRIETVELK